LQLLVVEEYPASSPNGTASTNPTQPRFRFRIFGALLPLRPS
jgi:hypothetical protein